jgi:hypothetical protein
MYIGNPSASFTRPGDTTPYTIGDLIANNTTAASVLPLTFSLSNSFGTGRFRLTRIRLSKTGTTNTNANFRIHLYAATPGIPANGDNGAFSTAGAANWLGNIDVASMVAFTDGCAGTGSAASGSEMFVNLAAGSTVFAYMAALAAYVPANAEVFTLTIEELDSY